MYPSHFEYHAPATVDEALSALERYGDEAKVLAGGQSLIPLMKLRFAAPRVLVDINRVEGLDGLERSPEGIRIGALVRHKTCERAQELRGRFGALADAAPLISDPIVRNLGTVAGSLAHADPQGDWGSVMLAVRARVEARSAAGTREIPIAEFFAGPFTSTLEANEIVTAVLVPDPGPRAGGTYLKLERKVGDFATVGVAVHVELDDGRVRRAGIGLTGVGPRNLSAPAAEEALADAVPSDDAVRGAAELAAEAAEPRDDVRGSAEFKRNVVRVYVERGLRTAVAAAQAREGDA